jgi:hypothetical protein
MVNNKQEKNFGILASIDWNSHKWQALSTPEDLSHSKFGFVEEQGITFTSLNFGHEKYPTHVDGYYEALLPQLWSRMPDKEKARYVEIVFVKSLNWEDNQNYLVGFYAFPIFKKSKKPYPIDIFPVDYEVNVRSLPKDICLLEHYINLKTHPDLSKFLPKGKELGKQGYNYLTKANVYKILDTMTILNPNNKKLKEIKFRLITSIDKKS